MEPQEVLAETSGTEGDPGPGKANPAEAAHGGHGLGPGSWVLELLKLPPPPGWSVVEADGVAEVASLLLATESVLNATQSVGPHAQP